MSGGANKNTQNNNQPAFGASFYQLLNSVGGTLITAALIALFTSFAANYDNGSKITYLDGEIIALKTEISELRTYRNVTDLKLTQQDTAIKKLQSDVDTIKYKIASIPDRNELNEALNTLYMRLRDANKNK